MKLYILLILTFINFDLLCQKMPEYKINLLKNTTNHFVFFKKNKLNILDNSKNTIDSIGIILQIITNPYPNNFYVILESLGCYNEKKKNLHILRAKYIADYLHIKYNIKYSLIHIKPNVEYTIPRNSKCIRTGIWIRCVLGDY